MIDAVLSYHTNPATCGVTKFNHQLADRLGVPHAHVDDARRYRAPLLSLKATEIASARLTLPARFDVLWHDAGRSDVSALARRVHYAVQLGCPATIQGNPTRGAYRVLVFGMAHKLALTQFTGLKETLDLNHPDYTIELSTAVHEGSPWDETLTASIDAMRAIFGDKLRVLGFLGDDALAKELQDCDAVAAFFTPALRANNTSAWAAVAAGKHLYTNRDGASPYLTQPPTWERLIQVLHAA